MSTTDLNLLGVDLPALGSLVQVSQEAIDEGYFPGICMVLDKSHAEGIYGDKWWELELLWPQDGGLRSWIPADYVEPVND